MSRGNGFTLIETLIFIIVVGIGVAGIAQLYVSNVQESATPLVRERGSALAKAFMDEIMAKRWDENTPVGGGCVETGSNSCTSYCAALSDTQCNYSKCSLTAPGNCEPAATVSASLGADEASRSEWDDLDDYNGYTPTTPQDIDGNDLTQYSGYALSVTVAPPGSAWNGVPAADVRRIEVNVTNPLGESYTLISYRVNM